jgi:hypothetical protein
MSRRFRTSTSTYRRGRAVLAAATGVACAAALAVAPASAASGGHRGLPVLKGIVGPGFTISISDDSVPAGRYKLVVNDKGTIHNFHIFGDGVDKATSIPLTGKTKFKVKLKVGTYQIQCDQHSTSMFTTLTVT